MPKKGYLYEEIEVPIFVTQATIPFEAKKQEQGFRQLCLDLPRMQMTFGRHVIYPTKDFKTHSELIACLDQKLTKPGRKLLCKVHDQTEVGVQRFYLHQLSCLDNFGLVTPDFFVNYSYSTLNHTLKLEVISKKLKGVSFENPDGERYLAEKKAYVRTITKYKIQQNQIKTSRKFFTNSGVIAGGLIRTFFQNILWGNIKIADLNNRYFITFCCLHYIHLLRLENQRIKNNSFCLFWQDRNKISQNIKKIENYEKMINQLKKEDISSLMENIFNDRHYLKKLNHRF